MWHCRHDGIGQLNSTPEPVKMMKTDSDMQNVLRTTTVHPLRSKSNPFAILATDIS